MATSEGGGEGVPPGRTNQANRLSDQFKGLEEIASELENGKMTKVELGKRLREELSSLRKLALELDIENVRLETELGVTRQLKTPAPATGSAGLNVSRPTAAEVLKRGLPQKKAAAINKVKKEMAAKSSTKVVIIPDNDSTVEETKRKLAACVDPDDAGFRVVRITPHAKKGGVTVHLANADGVNKLRGANLKAQGLKVKTEAKLSPRMVVWDVPSTMTDEGVVKLVTKQVQEKEGLAKPREKASVSVAFWLKAQDGAVVKHAVINVDGVTRETLVRMGRMYQGWYSYRVRDWLKVRRCHKCQSYGHPAATCRSSVEVCAHCCENHKVADCPNKEQASKCGACKAARRAHNHSVTNTSCESHKLARREYIARTDYVSDGEYLFGNTTPVQ